MNTKRSAASIALDALQDEMSQHPRNLDAPLPPRLVVPEPTAVALPDYVQHAEGATRAGMLSGQAIVNEFEATAKEMEKLGEELKAAHARGEERQAVLAKALADLTATVQFYREEAAKVFAQVEDVTAKASEATALCATLRSKVAQTATE